MGGRNRSAPDAEAFGLPVHVACPFCGGHETELHSAFGPQLSVATYWCRRCHSPFEWIKWQPRRRSSPGE
jgi:hypothetical protein